MFRCSKLKKSLVVLPSSPHQRAFVCGACIGTAQVGVSLVSLLDPLFKRSKLHCLNIGFTWYLRQIQIWWQYLVRTYRVYTAHRYATMPKLTCWHVLSVKFVKHMMINPLVRHHTHLDLTTCRVCPVKRIMIMHQWYDPYPLHACGLGVCLYFNALVCDLLPRRLFDGFC